MRRPSKRLDYCILFEKNTQKQQKCAHCVPKIVGISHMYISSCKDVSKNYPVYVELQNKSLYFLLCFF